MADSVGVEMCEMNDVMLTLLTFPFKYMLYVFIPLLPLGFWWSADFTFSGESAITYFGSMEVTTCNPSLSRAPAGGTLQAVTCGIPP